MNRMSITQQAKEENQLVERRNVTMYPRHWQVVDDFAQVMSYGTTSAALRRIIEEWKQYRTRQLDLPMNVYEPAQ